MNFTKEYIKLCENDKVQRLRKELQRYDYVLDTDDNKIYIELGNAKILELRSRKIWLPTSEQLDEEVVKICNEKAIDYSFKYIFSNQQYECSATSVPAISHSNPAIAKIKLLISLLEG